MKKIFSFATGNIYRWSKNKNNLINLVKKLEVNGVEITFAFKEELFSFRLSKDNRLWLRNLDYVTIHAPFRLLRRSENKGEVIKQLNIISKLYGEINAKNVIIHPMDLPPPELLNKYKLKISTENLPKRSHVAISDLRKILKKYPKVDLCLDVCHAYRWSKYETGKLIKAFKNRISQIHLSGVYKNKEHRSLRKVTKNFLYSIRLIKELNVPIVIEEDIFFKEKKLKSLKKEIEYIKRFII
jgi:sugar phosphate isomerase/epimerase